MYTPSTFYMKSSVYAQQFKYLPLSININPNKTLFCLLHIIFIYTEFKLHCVPRKRFESAEINILCTQTNGTNPFFHMNKIEVYLVIKWGRFYL